jgi:hypothetical protein
MDGLWNTHLFTLIWKVAAEGEGALQDAYAQFEGAALAAGQGAAAEVAVLGVAVVVGA